MCFDIGGLLRKYFEETKLGCNWTAISGYIPEDLSAYVLLSVEWGNEIIS
jgi:hypothetical protein